MRRLLYLLAAALVLPLFGSAALAAPQAELVRAFVYDRTLTAYVDLSGTDQPVTKAEAKIDGQTFPASQAMETVRQAGAPVTYLLLVDCSTSMPAYAGEVAAFAQALAEGAGENTRFILATFGEDFAVAAEELTAETLPQAVGGLAYEARSTRLQSGIQGALDYLEAIPRQGGELRSMVVLTDAVEYDPNGVESYEETLQRLENSDVMVHALGVGSDAASLESLFTLVEASGGSRFQAADETEADQAARTLTEETGRLYVTGFDLGSYQTEGGETAVAVTFASNGTLLCRAERNVDFPALEGEAPVEETPSQELPDSTPQQSSGGGTAPAPAEEETGAPWEDCRRWGSGVAGGAASAVDCLPPEAPPGGPRPGFPSPGAAGGGGNLPPPGDAGGTACLRTDGVFPDGAADGGPGSRLRHLVRQSGTLPAARPGLHRQRGGVSGGSWVPERHRRQRGTPSDGRPSPQRRRDHRGRRAVPAEVLRQHRETRPCGIAPQGRVPFFSE